MLGAKAAKMRVTKKILEMDDISDGWRSFLYYQLLLLKVNSYIYIYHKLEDLRTYPIKEDIHFSESLDLDSNSMCISFFLRQE